MAKKGYQLNIVSNTFTKTFLHYWFLSLICWDGTTDLTKNTDSLHWLGLLNYISCI